MRCSPRLRFSRAFPIQAFTLIELLVVISIIAVLAGLLLPVAGRVTENARRTSARATMTHIVSAVKLYQSEYGVYPVPVTAGSTPADTTYDDTKHNGTLFTVLRNMQVGNSDPNVAALNARRTVYFEYKDVKNYASPRDGFVPAPAAGNANPSVGANKITMNLGDLVDPWGNLYRVRVDTGYTDKVVDPFQSSNPTADDTTDPTTGVSSPVDSKLVHTSVIAWAIGQNSTTYDATKTTPTYDATGDVATWR